MIGYSRREDCLCISVRCKDTNIRMMVRSSSSEFVGKSSENCDHNIPSATVLHR